MLSSFASYLKIIVGGLALIAAAILIFGNLGNTASVHYYWVTLPNQSIGLIMLFAAIGGVVLYVLTRLLVSGAKTVYRRRREDRRMRAAAEEHQRDQQRKTENEQKKRQRDQQRNGQSPPPSQS